MEAEYYQGQEGGNVCCLLCPRHCLIREGETGFCRVRENLGGILYSKNYALVSSCAVDPVEKKPLYHFYPGKRVLSVGTLGCNLACRFCQNWAISQDHRVSTVEVAPAGLVSQCLEARRKDPACIGLAYTYSEPVVWYEYVMETAPLARQAGLKNVLVTNGFINPEPWARLLPWVDALNIDVKGFNDVFYGQMCSGLVEPVKAAVESAVKAGAHVEVTTLLIAGLNDGEEEIDALAHWLARLDVDIPLHLSRYFPAYMLECPPTPVAAMKRAAAVARRHLSYVYVGNVWGTEHNSTYCPGCGALLLRRHSLTLEENRLSDGACPRCSRQVAVTGGDHGETAGHSPGR